MAWKKSERIQEMHEMYLKGYSLAQVGEFFGVTRQSVYGLFKYNDLKMREKKELSFVVFNGSKYTIRNTGYYAKTDEKRTLLHRDMWEFHEGVIPVGWDVHHKDEDKLHNEMSNFECLPKADHTRLHAHGQNQHTKAKREKCGS